MQPSPKMWDHQHRATHQPKERGDGGGAGGGGAGCGRGCAYAAAAPWAPCVAAAAEAIPKLRASAAGARQHRTQMAKKNLTIRPAADAAQQGQIFAVRFGAAGRRAAG